MCNLCPSKHNVPFLVVWLGIFVWSTTYWGTNLLSKQLEDKIPFFSLKSLKYINIQIVRGLNIDTTDKPDICHIQIYNSTQERLAKRTKNEHQEHLKLAHCVPVNLPPGRLMWSRLNGGLNACSGFSGQTLKLWLTVKNKTAGRSFLLRQMEHKAGGIAATWRCGRAEPGRAGPDWADYNWKGEK